MPFSDQMTPEEIQQTAQALKEAFDAGAISAKDFNEGMNDVTAGVRNYTANLNASLAQLGTSAKKLGEGMFKGDTGMSQYNDVVASGGDAVAKAISKYGPAGQATAILIKILTFGFSQISAMADGLYKANQDLGKAGAAGKEGMSGIFEDMQKFGYGVADLGDMTALITKNSQSLGQFGGSVIEGKDLLANMAKNIKTSDLQRQFMNMGMSVNDINKNIAGYVEMQSSLGIRANESAEDQARGAAAYIKQQDLLTKMTGQSAEQLQQNRAEAQQVEAWNAKLGSMKPEEAAKYQAAFDTLRSTSKTAAMGFAASITGMTGMTKEASEAFQMTGGAINKLTQQYKDNVAAGMDSNLAAAELKQGMADAAAQTQGLATSVAMVGGSAGMGSIIEHQKMTALAGGKVIAAFNKVVDAQDGQINGYDENTNEQTKLLQQQMATRDSAQSIIEKGIGPAQKAFGFLNTVLRELITPFEMDAEAAAKGAMYGSVFGIAGTVIGSQIGGRFFGKKSGEGETQSGPGANEQAPSGGGGSSSPPELASISSKSGKTTQVGKPYAAGFQSLLDYLDNSGYKINSLGGYADRDVRGIPGKKSIHALGGAIDINPDKNPLGSTLVTDMPPNIAQVAAGFGLGWGGNWKSRKDAMHFSAARSEGGSMISARDGAILSGSQSGYQPNLTMHGTEAIVPMDKLEEMTAGKDGYTASSITSARSNVPIIAPFEDTADTNAPEPTQMSYFDKQMMDLDERIIDAIASNTRNQNRAQNARV